ncbi:MULTISPECIES: DNA repair protein RecO [Bacillales]|jgi:DNA repair protein RecO (recombination protein O)|uniref:DNA repair protein RecO n=1 Tax=Brevibacillus aydinogluensis TaxID=927786 RepID=A0AA48M8I7_9BACL|nr:MULTISPECIES: DNA repair protein RecO [Bacillales]MBR8659282.1 DNA repair protein RecO [Brevibacillus sp. NL20B1]MDT3414558.1 DNA repair protein RecO (recombination protein O) [Brevibacillus aydinogluensis]NNV02437.1 DNA repair protein RecO [Brevibacillus sp. MCWH]UFJ60132.1 DNA repair protein RecO [Anoxybacillus sediminis]CAJ1003223.1 DNA repair protein RecO [Brevibacillus aydinogluensis]
MLVKWEGIVIRSVDYGESSKVVTLFTREHGKVGIMARGAKKPKSRLGAVSQLFTHGYYLCKAGPGSGMPDLSQGEIVESFRDLRQNLAATAYAAYIAELLDRLTDEREANPFLFHMVLLLFRYLDEGRDAEILCRIFETKMLRVAGIAPHLSGCASCGAEREPYAISVSQGGLICPVCLPQDPYAIAVTPSVWKLLRLFQVFDLERLGEIEVKPATRSQLKHVLRSFLDQHLDLRLKSRAFLDQIENIGL